MLWFWWQTCDWPLSWQFMSLADTSNCNFLRSFQKHWCLVTLLYAHRKNTLAGSCKFNMLQRDLISLVLYTVCVSRLFDTWHFNKRRELRGGSEDKSLLLFYQYACVLESLKSIILVKVLHQGRYLHLVIVGKCWQNAMCYSIIQTSVSTHGLLCWRYRGSHLSKFSHLTLALHLDVWNMPCKEYGAICPNPGRDQLW